MVQPASLVTVHNKPAPPITGVIFKPRIPEVVIKDKSTHSEHGVIHYPFWFGGAASAVSTLFTAPLGITTLRLQTQPHFGPRRNLIGMFSHILVDEGAHGLWRGLTASMTRIATYSTIRFGAYEKTKELCTTPSHAPSPVTLAAIAAMSGFSGSVVGNFADVVCARMQNDLSHPPEERYGYKNIADGLNKMIRSEGWSSIWRGVWINAGRCGLSTVTQLAGYDVLKGSLLTHTSMKDTPPLHITASLGAGFLTTLICNPIDVIKARVITAKADNVGVIDAFKRARVNEGHLFMFKGLTPAMISRAPSTVIIFVTLEQLRVIYRHANDLEEYDG